MNSRRLLELDVLFVTNAVGGGGAESAVMALASGLTEIGLKVAVTPLRLSPDSHDMKGPEEPFLLFPLGKVPGTGIKGQLSAQARFLELLRRLSPRVVHVNCESSEALVALSHLAAATSLVATEHQLRPWNHRPRIGTVVRRRLRGQGVNWVVPREGVHVWGQDCPATVIPNALGSSIAPRVFPSGPPGRRRVIVVSSLIRLKRIDMVIRSMALLQNSNVELLVIGGDGGEEAFLRGECERLGVAATFAGFNRDPWSLAFASDVFVSASSSESDGLALREAGIVGLSVLASDISAHVSTVPRLNLFSTEQELTEKLLLWIDAPELFALPLESRRRLVLDRDPVTVARQHADFYESIISTKR
jgi:glycosyltransferase involved in cell wall biosynthesis